MNKIKLIRDGKKKKQDTWSYGVSIIFLILLVLCYPKSLPLQQL